MPKGFTDCVSAGGRVRTIKSHADTYRKLCFKNGKSYAGHQKKAKKSSKKK